MTKKKLGKKPLMARYGDLLNSYNQDRKYIGDLERHLQAQKLQIDAVFRRALLVGTLVGLIVGSALTIIGGKYIGI